MKIYFKDVLNVSLSYVFHVRNENVNTNVTETGLYLKIVHK